MRQSIDGNFNDALYEWMHRAPWLAISASAHVLLFIILLAIPWDLLRESEPVVIASGMEQLPQQVFEDPPPEEEDVRERGRAARGGPAPGVRRLRSRAR